MDANNSRPNQGNDSTMDTTDWRSQISPESRQKIVNIIMERLKKHLPAPGDPLVEVQNIAQRFEEKIYTAATSKIDYLRKISMKMLKIETISQNTTAANNMPSNQAGPSNNPSDQGLVMQQHSGSTIGQNSNVPDMFSGSQRQMTGRQQVVPQQQQQQMFPLQSQMHLQQQQNLLQPNQIQPSLIQSSPLSSLQQNQQSNNVQQSSETQQLMMLLQQHQQLHLLMGSQSNVTNMQHPQMLGPQNNVGDIRQQQRFLSQQNNLTKLQQLHQQQQYQQLLLNQQSKLENMLQQQRLIGPESGNPGMQTRQHSAHMLQHQKLKHQQQQIILQIQQLKYQQRQMMQRLQLKEGAPFSALSPQFFQAASPQIPQNSSPQVEQQNHAAASLTKVGTSLQSSNSPFVGPTPSPPLAPSPMPADSEKQVSGVSSVSNAASVGQQQVGAIGALTQSLHSLAIGTPGISASPLLAEFSGLGGAQGNAAAPSGKSTVTEQPIECLTRLGKSMSFKELSAAVSDIPSIVSMNDRIAGSAPGNGSGSSVGEDLVSMTNFHLQGRNLLTQDGPNGTKKIKRDTSVKPLNIVSSDGCLNDSTKHLSDSEASDMESTATSRAKRPKIEVNHALMEEVREINNQLVHTVVNLTNEDINSTVAAEAAEGTFVLNVDTEEDAKILRERGIVLNHLKGDLEVGNIWNGMNKSLRLSKVPKLDKVIEDVNKFYSGTTKVKVKKFMKACVFGSWQFLTLLATIFMFLMALQAFCSV